jgi:hypothetical protein
MQRHHVPVNQVNITAFSPKLYAQAVIMYSTIYYPSANTIYTPLDKKMCPTYTCSV